MIARRLLIAVIVLFAAALGLGWHVWRLARKVRQLPVAVLDTRPVAPPITGKPTEAVLFLADDSDGTLHQRTATVPLPAEPAKRGLELLRALVAQYQDSTSAHPLGAGADVLEVYLVNGSLAVVNVNGAFADGHRSGILVEELTLASLAQTLAANLPGITQMKLLVDGKERATLAGHAGLTSPYSVAGAGRLVR
jgi:hypothetical protein